MKINNQGFTLIEVLVVIFIFGVVSASLSQMFISVQSLQQQTVNVQLATQADQTEIESLRNSNYNSLTPGQSINFSSQLSSQLPPGSSGIAQISQPMPDLRRVDASVTYNFGGTTRTITVSSLIGVIGITQ